MRRDSQPGHVTICTYIYMRVHLYARAFLIHQAAHHRCTAWYTFMFTRARARVCVCVRLCEYTYVFKAWTGEVGPLCPSVVPSFLPSRNPPCLSRFPLPASRPIHPLSPSCLSFLSLFLSPTRECPSSHSPCPPDDRCFNVRPYMLGIPANERVSPPNIHTEAQTRRNLSENLSRLVLSGVRSGEADPAMSRRRKRGGGAGEMYLSSCLLIARRRWPPESSSWKTGMLVSIGLTHPAF